MVIGVLLLSKGYSNYNSVAQFFSSALGDVSESESVPNIHPWMWCARVRTREREREGGKERERAGGREGGGRGTDLLECYRIRSKVQYSKESEFSPGKIS